VQTYVTRACATTNGELDLGHRRVRQGNDALFAVGSGLLAKRRHAL